MTRDEAETVGRIGLGADDGCPVCAGSQLLHLAESFPEYRELFLAMYEEEFGYPLEEDE